MLTKKTQLLSYMAMGIALNYVGSLLALFLRLPIYLDSIGTMLMGALLGPWVGAGVAFCSSLLSWLTADTFSIYYAPVGMLIGILTGLVFQHTHKYNNYIWWQAALISLPGTILASLITVLLFKGITSSASSILVQTLYALGFDLVSSTILIQFLTDYLDRLLSLLACSLLLQRLKQ